MVAEVATWEEEGRRSRCIQAWRPRCRELRTGLAAAEEEEEELTRLARASASVALRWVVGGWVAVAVALAEKEEEKGLKYSGVSWYRPALSTLIQGEQWVGAQTERRHCGQSGAQVAAPSSAREAEVVAGD